MVTAKKLSCRKMSSTDRRLNKTNTRHETWWWGCRCWRYCFTLQLWQSLLCHCSFPLLQIIFQLTCDIAGSQTHWRWQRHGRSILLRLQRCFLLPSCRSFLFLYPIITATPVTNQSVSQSSCCMWTGHTQWQKLAWWLFIPTVDVKQLGNHSQYTSKSNNNCFTTL